jgi:phosphopantothenoylcysteine synthetase/decarboxylase
METKDTTKGAASTAPQQPKPEPVATPVANEGGADPTATAEAESRTGPRSPVVRFGQNFDYTWPSRAVTAYKAGWQGRVKAEVAKAAEDKGVLVEPLDAGGDTK